MSVIRTASRSAVVLCAVAVGTPAVATLLATPAAALCFGCGGHFHTGLASSMFVRRQAPSSFAVPANQQVTRLRSTQPLSPVTASRSVPSSPRLSKISHPKLPSSSDRKGSVLRSTRRPPSNSEFDPGGTSMNRFGSPGGLGQGVPGGDNSFSGGLDAVTPTSSGGRSGQLTSANRTGGNAAGTTRSLNGAGASNRSSTSGSGATNNATTSNTTADLTAVTVCMTRAGSCPMERDVGTACQCKDGQGNVYDGIVK